MLMKGFRMKGDSEKMIQELLRELFELNRQAKSPIRKLAADEDGVILLDKNNPDDVEWFENDKDYDVLNYEKKSSD